MAQLVIISNPHAIRDTAIITITMLDFYDQPSAGRRLSTGLLLVGQSPPYGREVTIKIICTWF